jgi:DNA repair photolyase
VRDQERRESWGQWVRVKENALELLRKQRRKPLNGVAIYLSSVTDPYQPIERKLNLTRAILDELATYHRVRLVVQTRSPLVTRDLDLLGRFEAVQVNMTVTTDDEVVRKVFEPGCASIGQRLRAIADVQRAGIATCITLTPLLPVTDPIAFAERLKATGVERFVTQYLHTERGQFVAGTRAAAVALCRERGWNDSAYRRTVDVLRTRLPHLTEGRDGFVQV